jgi:hypothetical protein
MQEKYKKEVQLYLDLNKILESYGYPDKNIEYQIIETILKTSPLHSKKSPKEREIIRDVKLGQLLKENKIFNRHVRNEILIAYAAYLYDVKFIVGYETKF